MALAQFRVYCRDMADRLVDDGFAKAGYTLVGIDDCWLANGRDSQGRLQPNAKRFPSGIKALADYVHKRWVSRMEFLAPKGRLHKA